MKTLIKNGLIYDGSGIEPFKADILIVDGIIAQVDKSIEFSEAKLIDAQNLIVTPGFIDSHRHADFAISVDPCFGLAELSQGITTILIGPCGMSAAPFRKGKSEEWYSFIHPCLGTAPSELPLTMHSYLDSISHLELPVNVGALVGMGSIRSAVKGFDSSPWNEQELAEASALLTEAVTSGVFGVSAGIMYTPECYSTKEDYIRLLSSIRDKHLPFVCHIRNEGDGLIHAIQEVIDVATEAKLPLNISHFKVFGKQNWGKSIRRAISMIDKARLNGMKISVDFYPYTGGATTLMTLVPPSCLKKNTAETISFLSSNEGQAFLRSEIVQKHRGWDSMVEAIGWDRIILSSVDNENNKKFQGKNFSVISKELEIDEIEFFVRLLAEEQGNAGIIVMSMDQNDVDSIAALPYSSVISDALYGSPDFPHPRLNGAFIKMLEDYSLNRGIIKLETAICKMTSQVAQLYQIPSRGFVKEGYIADLNLIQPNALRAEASFVRPLCLSKGVEQVLISGQVVYRNEKILVSDKGSVLRRSTCLEEKNERI